MSKILDCETDLFNGFSKGIETNYIIKFKYAPINSVDVERLFIIYKNVLSDHRKSFGFENISKIIVIQ